MSSSPIVERAQYAGEGISTKFIPRVGKREIMADILIALQRFRTSVRWKEY